MLRSLMALVTSVIMLAAQSVSATTTTSSVDTAGFGALCLQFVFGAFAFDTTNKLTVTIEHCDDDSTYVQCSTGDLYVEGSTIDTGIAFVANSASYSSAIKHVDYLGSKRYVRAVLTEGGTVVAVLAVNAIKGLPLSMPLR
jgi:hypothetical protein